MKKIKLTDLLIFIVAAELVGALSALFSGGGFGEFYAELAKPPISPPAKVFPIAWALLYALMGTASYLIYLAENDLKSVAMKLYILQLFVNFLWSPVFFGTKRFIPSLIIAGVLLALVILTTVYFAKINETAALLMAPYVLWSAYALYLTAGFTVLNN